MRISKVLLVSLTLAAFVGVWGVGMAQALTWADWTTNNPWFKVKVHERGKQAPVAVSPGVNGKVSNDKERDQNIYIHITSCDITATPQVCNVVICTPVASTPINATNTIEVMSGFPNDFLAMLDFTFAESTTISEQMTIPIRVKAKSKAATPTVIKSATIEEVKERGGIFIESSGDPVTQVGVGGVEFDGKTVPLTKVPAVCGGTGS